MATCKWMKRDLYLLPSTKVNSKWIKGLNIRPKPWNLIDKNSLEVINTEGFLNRIPLTLRPTISKWYFLKLKNFNMTKDTINWAKHQIKSFKNYTSNRGLISKIYKYWKSRKLIMQLEMEHFRTEQRVLRRWHTKDRNTKRMAQHPSWSGKCQSNCFGISFLNSQNGQNQYNKLELKQTSMWSKGNSYCWW